ncbi:MAG TPA: PEGA domain-containing protein, partial [Polyangiaceae bacterium]|nr:PEGA domain-containing protein [Polyangiaceae bacterium]
RPRPAARAALAAFAVRAARATFAVRAARAAFAVHAAGAALAALALGACQPNYEPAMAHVRMEGTPPDAVVTVDDRPVGALGTVARRGLALEPGKHRVSVEREGYFPWDAVIDAPTGDRPTRLSVRLERVPD